MLKNLLLPALTFALLVPPASAAEKIRVLFVGGDWKAQLPNYQGHTPLRGYFIQDVVNQAAPGRFEFTLWTSYEFLQYGDEQSLKQYDVIVAGDVMGQSVLPRLVKGLTAFVNGGGGFWYCDNHKAFSFYTKELSFDAVLPIEVVPFRPYGPDAGQPDVHGAFNPVLAAPKHPIMAGLDFSTVKPLDWAKYGTVKTGATVLATSPDGKPVWVAWDKGAGRALWTGGLFANDERSSHFVQWPDFGKFYVQALTWLAANSKYPRVSLHPADASGTLTVDLSAKGPEVSARHFSIHGQQSGGGDHDGMKGADLALYNELHPEGEFSRADTVVDKKGLSDGTDLTQFDWSKYNLHHIDNIINDQERIGAVPIFLYDCPWGTHPDPRIYTKFFAACIQHVNGDPASSTYRPRLQYFEIMNEPNLGPAPKVLNEYCDFYNYAAAALHARYPGIKLGCGGFNEWTYVQAVIDQCGKNLDWVSRHPYGHTGEAVFYLQDQYAQHAKERGFPDMKFIITEWDFWIYGEPAFDYIMQRWKPEIDHADSCLGSVHYRWNEYTEGGYQFGIRGEGNHAGELPPEWPHPARDQPITYRYDAFWAMRDCRGPQFATALDVPDLKKSPSTHAYAVATSNGKQYNIVIYYGYPVLDLASGSSYDKLKLHIKAPIPPEVQGRDLFIGRADAHTVKEEPSGKVSGNTLDMDLEVPALSAVYLTVR